jgi:hypothetical protein
MAHSKEKAAKAPPVWSCPACDRQFANRNQSHFCGNYDIERHFDDKSPEVRTLFEVLAGHLRGFGPVTILPEKTRIAFQVRMSFAVVSVRQAHLVGHFVLARRLEHPRFPRIDTISPRNHVHHFRISQLSDLDGEFLAWAREAYAVGEQKHIRPASGP